LLPRPAKTHAFVADVAAIAPTPWSRGLLMNAFGTGTARHAVPSQCRTITVSLLLVHCGSAHASPPARHLAR
jgi:hypothetical protein